MLRVNTTLQELAVGDNNITDDSAEFIAEALKINSCLTWLHMFSEDVTDIGAFALGNAISRHPKKLNYFYLISNPPITDVGRQTIKAALRVNAANNT